MVNSVKTLFGFDTSVHLWYAYPHITRKDLDMAIKKSQLYASLWKSCDALRGGMDASQYKDYILTLLFMKYVSDKAANDPYADVTVPEGGRFSDMVALSWTEMTHLVK